MTSLAYGPYQSDPDSLPGMSDACHASTVPEVDAGPVPAGGKPASGSVQTNVMAKPTEESAKPFAPAVKPSHFVRLCVIHDPEYAARYEHCAQLAKSWAKTRLETLFKAEYDSMRSR